METNLDHIQKDIIELKTMLANHIKFDEAKYVAAEKKYASKWVEKFVIAIIVGGVLAFISYVKY